MFRMLTSNFLGPVRLQLMVRYSVPLVDLYFERELMPLFDSY
jgi:hypothetical protein